MLKVEQISVSYDGSRILRDVSFEVPAQQLVCLMGRNGVGKSTALRSIVGLLKLGSGSIRLDGQEITSLAPPDRARLGIGYVPQGRDIFPNLTVLENLRIGAVARGRKLNGELDRVFQLFPVLKEMRQRKGGVLSGGQQQQLAMARALLTGPKLLILDEPTEGIQPSIIDEIEQTLRTIRSEGQMSILLVEQYLDFARALADRFYIMDRGAIAASGGVQDLNDEVIRKHLTV
ncbi:MAG: urea ABC transporter ATP-binding subunit UrtE [Verrucomicrobia bacterium]|nr:urea ABC transporter ATP-binding subunit UrtE [Verrucomicrobiota bacterium]